MKKAINLFLALFVIIGCFSGCGESGLVAEVYDPNEKISGDLGGLKLPLVDENTKITWYATSDITNLNDSYVVKKIRAVTGIDLELIAVPLSASDNKKATILASGNLPNIMAYTMEDAEDIASQNSLACIEDYLDILPNFRKNFVENEDNNWVFKTFALSDGRLYSYYGYDLQRDVNHGTLYRKDIFDKHGIPMWNNEEEFYQALKKLKELYPDSYPFVSKNADALYSKLAPSWGLSRTHEPYYNEEKKEWFYADTSPEFKAMLEYLKKLYDEKLIDPEFITRTQSSWQQLMSQKNKAFVTWDWIGRLEQFTELTSESVPGYDLRYGNPIGPAQKIMELDQTAGGLFVAKKSDKIDEAAFKLMDFVASPAGKELITMGVEGETYEMGEDGFAEYYEFPGDIPTINELEEKYGMFIQGVYLGFDRRSSYFKFSEREQEAQEFIKKPGMKLDLDPQLVFTPEENERRNSLVTDLKRASQEFSLKYIMGNAKWEDWIAKAKSLNVDELVKIYNDAQKRYDAM